MTVKVGLLGLGRIGRIHLKNILYHIDQMELSCVYDPNPDTSLPLIQKIQPMLVTNEQQFWQGDWDAVIIGSPSDQHGKQIHRAIDLKKSIFCEKPIDPDYHVCEELVERVNRHQVNLQIGFNRRFDRDFQVMFEHIHQNQFDPHVIKITSRDPGLPSRDYLKASGGMFFDMTIHDFDMAQFLIGSPIVEIYAMGGCLIDPSLVDWNDIDTGLLSFKFANGCLGVIDNSRQACYGYDQRVEVFGRKGCLRNENHLKHNVTTSLETGSQTACLEDFFLERYKESYCTELEYFARSLLQGISPQPNLMDGIRALRVARAADQSRRSGQPVVIPT